jgi:solute carrier family 25, member 42
MHIASDDDKKSSASSSPLLCNHSATPCASYEVLLKHMIPLTPHMTPMSWSALLHRYDTDQKGGLNEAQWCLLIKEQGSLIGNTVGTVVDFGRIAEVPTGMGAPINLRRRKSVAEIVIEFLEGFIAGGLAGAVSKSIIAPADRVKIIFQVDPSRAFSLRNAVDLSQSMVKEGGVLSLWKGNGATMMRVVPYASITFMSFEHYHTALKVAFRVDEDEGSKTRAVAARFVSGALAGATATAFTYPLDLMRARFAAGTAGTSPSYVIAFRDVIRTQGVTSLYSGLVPTLLGIMPYAGSSFACFETIKFYLVLWQHLEDDKAIPPWQRIVAGGFSGLVAQSFTYPLDIVRRRLQVQPKRYRGIAHALAEIHRNEGVVNGLYKGLTMNWIKGPIAVATSFTINDIVKTRIRQYHKKADEAARDKNGRPTTWFAESALCGAAAGAVAKFWTAPFDRMKIVYQVGQQAADDMTFGRHARSIMSEFNSDAHMWQGSGAMIMRVVPYAAITYACFDNLQPWSQRVTYSHSPCFASNFIAGATAATIATGLLYPLDMMHTRTAASPVKLYDSYYLGMREVFRTRGLFALWEGAGASIVGIGPMAGLGFALYEDFKKRFECDGPVKRLVAGAAAGAIAQAVTYPFNVVRRRAQVDTIIQEGFVRSMKNIYNSQGFYSGLYQRMPFGWTMGAMTVGISFSINDFCKDSIVRAKKEIRETASIPSFSQFRGSPTSTPTEGGGFGG